MSEREKLRLDVKAFLDAHTVMSLTLGGAHALSMAPHVVSLMYVADDWCRLYWVSSPDSIHSKQIGDGAPAAIAIADQFDDFTSIHGLQLSGTADPIADPLMRRRAKALMAERYAFLAETGAGSEVGRRFAAAGIYRFDPSEIVLIDNRRTFGDKRVLHLNG